MANRLTERVGHIVTYIGKFTKAPGIDCAASMRVAARRECMERLADYEDLGKTPEELSAILQEYALMKH